MCVHNQLGLSFSFAVSASSCMGLCDLCSLFASEKLKPWNWGDITGGEEFKSQTKDPISLYQALLSDDWLDGVNGRAC